MPTKLSPKQLFEKRNTSDVFIREVILGVLGVLNKKLVYTQIWNEKENLVENITVPFLYDFTGGSHNSEKFIQDNFMFFGEDGCTLAGIKKVDGNFDMYPRGILSLKSTSIESGSITNRFVMGQYTKKVDGEFRSFVSFLYSIPLTLNFSIEVRSDTMLTAMKIEQAFREYFYKNKVFHIMYKGTKVSGQIGFPDAVSIETNSSFQMGGADNNQYIKSSIELTVETYQPVWDPENERPATNYIKDVVTAFTTNGKTKTDGENKLEFATDYSNSILSAGSEIRLDWKQYYEYLDNPTMVLSYMDNSTGEEVVVTTIRNNQFFNWRIPEILSSHTKIDCIIPNTDTMQVYKVPEISVLPDPTNGKVTKSQIEVKSKGYFITKENQVNGSFSYLSKDNKIIDVPFILNLYNNMIDLSDPIEFKPFIYNNDINASNIDVILRDANNKDIKAVMQNITVL